MPRPEGSTRLDSPIEIPEDASERDAWRLSHTNRNLRIRREYPQLKNKHGWQEARKILAERYSCSVSTVQKVLEGKR